MYKVYEFKIWYAALCADNMFYNNFIQLHKKLPGSYIISWTGP